MRRTILPTLAILVAGTCAHGDHGSGSQQPAVADDANWITKHMAGNDGVWQGEEILRTYGLFDKSNKDVPQEKRDSILKELLGLLDQNSDGEVSREELAAFLGRSTLPDMGTGPGHHGDEEFEYEIHHWEKYHNDETQLEDLTHPEDIEHFKLHDKMEEEEERLEELRKRNVIEENIPAIGQESSVYMQDLEITKVRPQALYSASCLLVILDKHHNLLIPNEVTGRPRELLAANHPNLPPVAQGAPPQTFDAPRIDLPAQHPHTQLRVRKDKVADPRVKRYDFKRAPQYVLFRDIAGYPTCSVLANVKRNPGIDGKDSFSCFMLLSKTATHAASEKAPGDRSTIGS
ncbi:unnamed protein product [Parascedosporium putredinis]|uniref:EF-hand domain-containing protein n=1 Tax=Parascedosporium putredinis TaxID=1442378 RepID=A0A9P1GV35_9PEZI|nr:unnamed protein product [Parascedosporium putredinis]CAI7987915.1 unnamed protein product [Parascedosporium putredinis]